MAEIEATVEEVAAAADWNVRVSLIRRVPEAFGTNLHRDVYARIAERVYVPNLVPDFAYVHWRADYELPHIEEAYRWAHSLTNSFTRTDIETLTQAVATQSRTLLVFRLLLGLTAQELAAATRIVAERHGIPFLSVARVKSLEAGSLCKSADGSMLRAGDRRRHARRAVRRAADGSGSAEDSKTRHP
jgi:hypothetical protein